MKTVTFTRAQDCVNKYMGPMGDQSGEYVPLAVAERLQADRERLLKACRAVIEEFKHLGQALGEYTPGETVDVWNLVEAAIAEAEKP